MPGSAPARFPSLHAKKLYVKFTNIIGKWAQPIKLISSAMIDLAFCNTLSLGLL